MSLKKSSLYPLHCNADGGQSWPDAPGRFDHASKFRIFLDRARNQSGEVNDVDQVLKWADRFLQQSIVRIYHQVEYAEQNVRQTHGEVRKGQKRRRGDETVLFEPDEKHNCSCNNEQKRARGSAFYHV